MLIVLATKSFLLLKWSDVWRGSIQSQEVCLMEAKAFLREAC